MTQYHNAVSRFDAGLGLLLEELDRSSDADNTLILLAGDRGPPFVCGKTSCYEGGVKVPMLAVWPRVFKPGERTPALVGTVDFLPTILDAVAQPLPPVPLHGRSLSMKRTAALSAACSSTLGGSNCVCRRSTPLM